MCLGESDEDLLQSAKVLVASDRERGREEKGLVLLAKVLGRLAPVLCGLEKVLVLVEKEGVRLDKDLVLSAA